MSFYDIIMCFSVTFCVMLLHNVAFCLTLLHSAVMQFVLPGYIQVCSYLPCVSGVFPDGCKEPRLILGNTTLSW